MEPKSTRSEGMATAALVLGILAILFICCGGSVVLGALGIMFALLSRGAGTMDTKARVGMGLSVAGMIISVILIVVIILFSVRSESAWDFMDEFLYEYEEYIEDSGELEEYNEYFYESGDGFYDMPYEEFEEEYDYDNNLYDEGTNMI